MIMLKMPTFTPILTTATSKRDSIRNKTVDAVKAAFPIEGARHVLSVEDVAVHPEEYGSSDQKRALLEGSSLTEPIKGTLILTDKATGKVVARSGRTTLLHLPWFSERHTMIVDGNEYSVSNQVRLKPGVYTRRRGNEELESQFNLVKKGGNFSLAMEPETGKLHIRMGGSNVDLYPVLRGIGVPHSDIAAHWGAELAAVNEQKYGKKIEPAIQKLYEKVTPEYRQTATTHEARSEAVRNWLGTAKLDPKVTQKTLGVSYDTVKPDTLLKASQKLINVFRSAEDVDDRDSLEFKRVHQLPEFLAERVMLTARDLRRKIIHKMDRAGPDVEIKNVVPAGLFTPGVKSFLTQSDVSQIPTSYNPMEVIDASQRVSPLGEGGIGDLRAVPFEARQVHHTHFGIIDPIRTSESSASGADVRAAIHAVRDEEGNLYTPLTNHKTGKSEYVSAAQLSSSTVAFPQQNMSGKKHVDALVNGVLRSVLPSQVDFVMGHPASMYSPATSIVPLIESMQGNRALMAAKMQTQALALKHREAPLVQVKNTYAPQDGATMGEVFGRMTVPIAPVSGTIEKIDGDYIYIRPHATKHAAHADERLGERAAALDESVLKRLRGIAATLKPNQKGYYLALPWDKGYAAFKTVGSAPAQKVVLATILAPHMHPNGEELHKSVYEKVAAAPDLIRVKYDTNLPMGAKSFLHNELMVKPGDEVKKDQALAESNFTRGGHLALGVNLKTGYMSYHGLNSNDAIVISESAARKLTSLHSYKEVYDLDGVETGKDKHRAYYGNKFNAAQYAKLDDDGCAKKGSRIDVGDPIFAGLTKTTLSAESAMLGKLHKSLVKPYRDNSHVWDHSHGGEVVDVFKTPKRWAIVVRTEEPMDVGSKISGSHGNKGVVSAIIPDAQMIQDESGEPIDILLTSAGVSSRINPSQVIETALGKVAKKTGKPVVIEQFSGEDNLALAKKLLKEHGLKDKETVYDPIADKHIPGIMVGYQNIIKLMKTTDTNFKARGVANYDINQQPSKSGDESSSGLGRMEVAALVAHNARNMLRENSTIRSQRNDEFWRRLQLGLPPPPPKASFAYDKFGTMLTGAGINFNKNNGKASLGPLTDAHVKALSRGPITNTSNLFVRAKDLKPEEGGLFDPVLTGGPDADGWTHVDLHEPVINPVFEDPARRLLGMTGTAFRKAVADNGAGWVKHQLSQIDPAAKIKSLREDTKTLRGAKLDDAVKQVKYLEALKEQGLAPQDAYVLSKIPVVPPNVRPIVPSPRGDLLINDANYLYRDLILANEQLRVAKHELGTEDAVSKARTHLHDATSALFGMGDPVSPQNQSRGVKGFMAMIAGVGSPKFGFAQGKLIKKQLDLSGRGTIVPDVNLGIDQIGVPEEMLWTMFGPFVVGRLIRKGYEATLAKKMFEDRAPAARAELLIEAKERPVVYNRAPTLHRGNIIGAYPVPVTGQTIRLPATWPEAMQNADYDGDQQLGRVFIEVSDSIINRLARSESPPYELEDWCMSNFWTTRKASPTVVKNLKVLLADDCDLYTLDLSEVPHLPAYTQKDNIQFHAAVPGMRVVVHDEKTGGIKFAPLAGWSKHEGCKVEIVTLRSGAQIFTDDDPRGVYGYDPGTDSMVRRRPSEAIGVFVPLAHHITSLTQAGALTSIPAAVAGSHDVHTDIQLDSNSGYVMGLVIGDGWVSQQRQVCLANIDEGVAMAFEERLSAFFPEVPGIGVVTRTGGDFGPDVLSQRHTLTSSSVAQTLSPLVGHGAHNKHLPPFFLNAPEEFRLGLLAGLIDTDGSISISNAKAKPQWMINYSTVSVRLAYELVYLTKSMGVRASVTAAKTPRGGPAYTVSISSVDMQKLTALPLAHSKKRALYAEFLEHEFSNQGGHTGKDVIPLSAKLSRRLMALCPVNSVTYGTLSKSNRVHSTSRRLAATILAEHPELRVDQDAANWVKMVDSTDVTWSAVATVEKTGLVETGYDLHVPGYETFMTVDGVILSNTVQIHTPVTRGAVEDAKNMTLQNQLFADKVKGKMWVQPTMEAVIGAYKATSGEATSKPVKHFKNKAAALAAYRSGTIGLHDRVEVGDK